jgi:uncharacterized protein
MKTVAIIAFLITSTILLNGQSIEKNFIDQNYIEVTGKAQMDISPDIFFVQIQISEKDSKPKTSIDESEKAMITKLKDIGIDEDKDLSVNDLSSNFQKHLVGKPDINVSKDYVLIVHNTKSLFKVFTSLESIGISNSRILKVESSKIIEYRNEVKIKAIQAAKEKASMLATAINQTIGRAIFIQENNQWQTYSRTSNTMLSNSILEEPSEQNIDYEKITIDYSILVRFELK